MKPKFVIGALIVIAAVIFVIQFSKNKEAVATPTAPAASEKNVSETNPATSSATPSTESKTISQTDTNSEKEDPRKAAIAAELERLSDLEVKDDPASLQQILADLTNSEPQIRWAAVESAIQFGSRDAIPVFTNLAARIDDPREKQHLLDSAAFLALPSWTEMHQKDPNGRMIKVESANPSGPPMNLPNQYNSPPRNQSQ